MKNLLLPVLCLFFSSSLFAGEWNWVCEKNDSGNYSVKIIQNGNMLVQSPEEGLWAFAEGWENGAPSRWVFVSADEKTTFEDTVILSGKVPLADGELRFRDAYSLENGMLKCVRRYEYTGTSPVENITLNVRWNVVGRHLQAFLPGILYYGNPSGEKNTPNSVPVYHGLPGEFAVFEEHRFPMPFACLEDPELKNAAALHSLPSPALRGSVPDQWWSLGVRALDENTSQLNLYSGFIGYNRRNSAAKALQARPMEYPQATIRLIPGTIIEKTFYLDVWNTTARGTGFQRPIQKSMELFQPYALEGLPTREFILKNKFTFARSRWIEGENYAGFNMYPTFGRIVMGWCGQADSLGFALQKLEPKITALYDSDEEKESVRRWIRSAVQRSMDHLSAAPLYEDGFSVEYDPKTGEWDRKYDPVSMGQALFNFAQAIKAARENRLYDTSKWETFLQKAADLMAARILREDWNPRSTSEGFLIAPLILSSELFGNETYKKAAVKAADFYAARHLSMVEPYWGGTLDARCEDKEGAWAAFQGFLYMYEVTHDEKYLHFARHACDVCLSYTVVWDIPLPPGRLSDHAFKTRGWTVVSPQNQHLDVFGVFYTPEIYRMGELLNNDAYKRISEVMFRSCGQLTDPFGSQGEQIQQTNFAQQGDMTDVLRLRGGYAETWTVFWITAHFLNAEARRP